MEKNTLSITTTLATEDRALIFTMIEKIDIALNLIAQSQRQPDDFKIYPDAEYKFSDIKNVVNSSISNWNKRVREGKAPPKIKRGRRDVYYSGAEILRFLAEKESYRAPRG